MRSRAYPQVGRPFACWNSHLVYPESGREMASAIRLPIPMACCKSPWMNISWKILLLVIGIASLTIRALLDSDFGRGTLLYILVPFVISLVLAFFTKSSENSALTYRYLNHLRIATIIFFATSIVLFEGFICVLMFMPIYYFFVSLGFFFAWLTRDRSEESKDKSLDNIFRVSVVPVLMLMLVSEGLIPNTTVERTGSATYVADSPLSITQLQSNMAKPIEFGSERHWFLQLFPMPDAVAAGSLNSGDVHKVHFTYKRWFFTNVHKGEMHIKIAKVTPEHVRTEITRNDSYLANYMDIGGTDIRFTPLPGGGTRVALTVRYERLLDPAWYFGPMQTVAAKQSAKQFLRDIIFRHPVEEAQDGI